MNETNIQLIASLKIIWIAVFSFFYGWGGISGKWKRRYLGAAWAQGGVVLFSMITSDWNWWYLTWGPALIGALTLGYGGDTLAVKLKKRALYGLAVGISPLALAIVNATFWLLGLHVFLCVLISVALGVFNITKNARSEETVIGTTAVFLPMFMV